ncbi:hypothetical protein E2C01_073026 [Portunus trituberculatus]|uniref:Uncharacterized protein n=1 Tax=Portunus trituberculatus TaxID=210409 RepID=A0A5B7IC91_PORTR|nr:hypothetical protein [Portunus trituberculatus]
MFPSLDLPRGVIAAAADQVMLFEPLGILGNGLFFPCNVPDQRHKAELPRDSHAHGSSPVRPVLPSGAALLPPNASRLSFTRVYYILSVALVPTERTWRTFFQDTFFFLSHGGFPFFSF